MTDSTGAGAGESEGGNGGYEGSGGSCTPGNETGRVASPSKDGDTPAVNGTDNSTAETARKRQGDRVEGGERGGDSGCGESGDRDGSGGAAKETIDSSRDGATPAKGGDDDDVVVASHVGDTGGESKGPEGGDGGRERGGGDGSGVSSKDTVGDEETPEAASGGSASLTQAVNVSKEAIACDGVEAPPNDEDAEKAMSPVSVDPVDGQRGKAIAASTASNSGEYGHFSLQTSRLCSLTTSSIVPF